MKVLHQLWTVPTHNEIQQKIIKERVKLKEKSQNVKLWRYWGENIHKNYYN